MARETRDPRDSGHDWSQYQHHILAELDRLSLLVVQMHERIERAYVDVSLLSQTSTRMVADIEKLGTLKADVALMKHVQTSKTMIWVAVIGGCSGALGMIGTVIAAYLR
jgi:hypothetical protein